MASDVGKVTLQGQFEMGMELCPKCEGRGVSPWGKLFAHSPSSTRCSNCGAKLRIRLHSWQNVVMVLVTQGVFLAILIVGILNGSYVGAFFAGLVLSLVTGIVLTWLCKPELEVVSN
jgi:hypothetical protein